MQKGKNVNVNDLNWLGEMVRIFSTYINTITIHSKIETGIHNLANMWHFIFFVD